MPDPQIEIIKEIFPEKFHPDSQEILRLKNDIEAAESHNSELASYIRSQGGDLFDVLVEHLCDAGTSFWSAVHECARRENSPLDCFLARWRERGWKGKDVKIESDEESYKQKWEKYKNDIPIRQSNEIIPAEILIVIEKWSDFPLEELYSIVDDYPKDVVLFCRSKRLSAIVTLNPEPLRNVLKKRPEALHLLVFNRLFNPNNSFLDPSVVIGGCEDFIELARSNSGSLPQITLPKALAAVGTPRARACAQEFLHLLSNIPPQVLDIESNLSPKILNVLHLSRLPEDRPWLSEFLNNDQELLTEALKFVSDDLGTQWHGNAEFWFSLICNQTLLPLAMTVYVSDRSCSDSLWRNTVKRLLPDDDVVVLTAKLAATLPGETKNQIIEAQLLLELSHLLDSDRLEKAEATIRFALTAIPEFFNELGIKLTPAGIKPSIELNKLLNGTIEIWGWLNGELLKGQTEHNVKGIVGFLYQKLKPFHGDQVEQPHTQLFSALHAIDRSNYFDALKKRFRLRLVEPDRDASLVEQFILASKERILVKVQKYTPELAVKLIDLLGDDYPSRFRLERLLAKELGWAPAEDGNETFKLLDRLDDDTLPGLLRESLSRLIHSEQDLWHHYCYLATFLRQAYPDYPQVWTRAITALLDKGAYKDLNPEWVRALAVCLGFLREPWGHKVPQLLRAITNDASLGEISEDIKTQAALFNRENFNKGHHRLERRRVDDVKRYLARTSRLIGRKHKI